MAELLDKTEKYLANLKDLMEQQDVILGRIHTLDAPYDRVLEVRYTRGKRYLAECCEETGYSYGHLKRIHYEGLLRYGEIFCKT
jgi:hypothetical protein